LNRTHSRISERTCDRRRRSGLLVKCGAPDDDKANQPSYPVSGNRGRLLADTSTDLLWRLQLRESRRYGTPVRASGRTVIRRERKRTLGAYRAELIVRIINVTSRPVVSTGLRVCHPSAPPTFDRMNRSARARRNFIVDRNRSAATGHAATTHVDSATHIENATRDTRRHTSTTRHAFTGHRRAALVDRVLLNETMCKKLTRNDLQRAVRARRPDGGRRVRDCSTTTRCSTLLRWISSD
jgi:hypothetical protein